MLESEAFRQPCETSKTYGFVHVFCIIIVCPHWCILGDRYTNAKFAMLLISREIRILRSGALCTSPNYKSECLLFGKSDSNCIIHAKSERNTHISQLFHENTIELNSNPVRIVAGQMFACCHGFVLGCVWSSMRIVGAFDFS